MNNLFLVLEVYTGVVES